MVDDLYGQKLVDVTVVLPVYNGERYLASALRSVLAQTCPAQEILVVDDGSTDGTAAVLSEFNNTIRVLRQANRGVSAARNVGIRESRSSWVALLDADDLWHPKKIERFSETQSAHPEAILYYSDAIQIDAEGRRERVLHSLHPPPDVWAGLLCRNYISTSSVVFRRGMAIDAGLFREDFICRAGVEDWEFFLRLAKKGPFSRVPGFWTHYRRHDGSAIQTQRLSLRDDALRVIALNADGISDSLKRRAESAVYRESAIRHLAFLDLVPARKDLVKSLQLHHWSVWSAVLWILSLTGKRTVGFLLKCRSKLLRICC